MNSKRTLMMEDDENSVEILEVKPEDVYDDDLKVLQKTKKLKKSPPSSSMPSQPKFKGRTFEWMSTGKNTNVTGYFLELSLNCLFDGCSAGLTFCDMKSLDKHMSLVHGMLRYRCYLRGCGASFGTRAQLSDHLAQHSHLTIWMCGICSLMNLTTHATLERHVVLHHLRGHFQCVSCFFTAPLRAAIIKHHQKEHQSKMDGTTTSPDDDDVLWTCTDGNCGKVYQFEHSLRRHIRVTHEQKKKKQLEDEAEDGTATAKTHRYECQQCRKVFSFGHHFRAHRRVHLGIRPYYCTWPECTFDAAQKSDAISHIRQAHFKLPRRKVEQVRKGIVDSRDARDWVGVREELMEEEMKLKEAEVTSAMMDEGEEENSL